MAKVSVPSQPDASRPASGAEIPAILGSRLPPIEKFFCRGEADYYGIGWRIAMELGLRNVPYSRGFWKHGWPFGEIAHPRQLTQFAEPGDVCLVPRAEHAEFLRTHGFERAEAAGLPFAYVPPIDLERVPRSLLVMPAHTTWNHEAARWREDEYAADIASLRPRFDLIVACVHSNCFRTGVWVDSFRRHGIPCVVGARINDRNALVRQAVLFRTFECVTGNQIGSWVPYAASCGARVSIWGELAMYDPKDYEKDPFMTRYPEVLELFFRNSEPDNLRRAYGWLFAEPDRAEERIEWGAREIGAENRRAAGDIARLFGWNDARTQWTYRTRILPRLLAGRIRFYAANGSHILRRRIGALRAAR